LAAFDPFLDNRLKEHLLCHVVGVEDDTQDEINAIMEDQ
jgi:hypothetical protein